VTPRTRLGIVAACFLLTACSPFGWSEDRFYEKLGRATCEKAFECDTQEASETWFNQENCEQAFGPIALASMEAHTACKYKRTKAKKYVKLYKKLDCIVSVGEAGELEQAWNDVYECEGEATTGTGDTAAPEDTGLPTSPTATF